MPDSASLARRLQAPLLVIASLRLATALGADFIFGEDFEGVPACNLTGFVVAATPAPLSARLGTQTRHLLKVRACGVSGTVTLGTGDIPVTWGASIDNATFNLADGQVGVAALLMTVPTDSAGGLATFNATATNAGNVTTQGPVSVNVVSEWILHFAPDGTAYHNHVFLPAVLTIKLGAKIRLIDDDSTENHTIHASGGSGGFTHQPDPGMTQGQEWDITPTAPTATQGLIYCHAHGTGVGQMHVNVIP